MESTNLQKPSVLKEGNTSLQEYAYEFMVCVELPKNFDSKEYNWASKMNVISIDQQTLAYLYEIRNNKNCDGPKIVIKLKIFTKTKINQQELLKIQCKYTEIFQKILHGDSTFINDCMSLIDMYVNSLPKNNFKSIDHFLQNFNTVSRFLFKLNQLMLCIQLWNNILSKVLEIEKKNDTKIHKGTIYYMLGFSFLKIQDIDYAYYYLHKAYKEDFKKDKKKLFENHSPALKIITLSSNEHLLGAWNSSQEKSITNQIQLFNKKYNKELTFEVFNNEFIKRLSKDKRKIEIVFQFTYVISVIMNLEEILLQQEKNNICGIIAMRIFSNLCVIIELLLKENYANGNYSISQKKLYENFIQTMDQKGIDVINKKTFNDLYNDSKDSEKILKELLWKKYKGISVIGRDFAIQYVIRNHAAHNVSATELISKNYIKIRDSIFNFMFFIIFLKS